MPLTTKGCRRSRLSRLLEGIIEAFTLIIQFDPYLWQIIILSLQVSGGAVALSTLTGVPLGAFLGLKPAGRTRFISKVLYTFMGLPPVVAGLVIYLLISRSGPFGVLGLLFSPAAMVIAQFTLATPIIAGLTMVGIRSRGKEVQETARTLGANRLLTAWTVIRESRFAIFGAIVTGFGRVIAEVGAVMIVGGNIEGHTRVMTSAIVLETSKGHFELAIGLGLTLLVISFLINSLLYYLQGGGENSGWK
ncbi:MAG TPA: ABC transporter permease [Firmicutes bacterium]|nr:ABC transporter permease [Bacillota bacterium]